MQNVKSIIFFFPENFVSRHSFPRDQSIPCQTARRRLSFTNSRAKQPRSTDCEMRSSSFPFAYLAGVDEEGVVDSSYHALCRPIVRCFVQTRARSWRRRTRDASPIARSGGGAKGRKKPARWWRRDASPIP